MRTSSFICFCILTKSCNDPQGISASHFKDLMNNVAEGWSNQDTELALGSFHKEVVYMEPPNIQYYSGIDQLRPYFDALEARHSMIFHNLWFDEATQTGAGEYTFSGGGETSDTGMVMVQIRDGKIIFWREYQRKGPTDFSDFIDSENKEWKWTIENYP